VARGFWVHRVSLYLSRNSATNRSDGHPEGQPAKKLKIEKTSKPRSQTEQAQAEINKTASAADTIAISVKEERTEKSLKSHNKHSEPEKVVESRKRTRAGPDNHHKPWNISRSQLPETPAAYMSEADSTQQPPDPFSINLNNQQAKNFEIIIPQGSTSTQISDGSNKDQSANPLQPEKSDTTARKGTPDLWVVSDDESDTPNENVVSGEVRSSPPEFLSGYI
jgi:hypothetical protein